MGFKPSLENFFYLIYDINAHRIIIISIISSSKNNTVTINTVIVPQSIKNFGLLL